MTDRDVGATYKPTYEMKLGYRAKTEEEKTGPNDYGLVPVDRETQAKFEKNVLTLLRKPSEIRGD